MSIEQLFKTFPQIDCGAYRLRELQDKDIDGVYALYADESSLKYQAGIPYTSREEAVEAVENYKKGYESGYFIRWCVASKATDEFMGLLACHHIDYRDNNAQLGYMLDKRFRGEGVMTKTLSTLIDYLFNEIGLERLELSIHPENQASIALGERLGFETEGLRKHCAWNPAAKQYEDRLLMGLVKGS